MSRFFFICFTIYRGNESHSLYQRLSYIEVCYIEVPLYMVATCLEMVGQNNSSRSGKSQAISLSSQRKFKSLKEVCHGKVKF